MSAGSHRRSGMPWLAAGMGLAAGAYATVAGLAWCWYGRAPRAPQGDEADPELTFAASLMIFEVRGRILPLPSHQARKAHESIESSRDCPRCHGSDLSRPS